MKELGIQLLPEVDKHLDELVALRRDLHAHPELSFEERRTHKVVTERLEALGLKPRTLAKTGVTADIVGKEDGTTLLLRADMDALPIEEKNPASYRSVNEGAMHACGHDGHTAMLLTAAKVLVERGVKRGRVRLIFQPAEEVGDGAEQMIKEGILESPRPGGALAFHVWSGHPIGEAAVLDGPVMASVDGFEMVVTGKGTHAAVPEEGIDPVVLTAAIITGAQEIITRRKTAFEPAVLSFSTIHGGTAFNIIPQEVRVKGTIRTFNPRIRKAIVEDLKSFAGGMAASRGASVSFDFFEDLEATVNDRAFASRFREVAERVVGPRRVTAPYPLMGGEDMGMVLREVPGALILLGCGNPKAGIVNPHHHPCFDMDERVLAIGVELFVRFAESFLTQS